MTETWKPIKETNGLFEISNIGNVRSVTRTVLTSNGHFRTYKGVPISPYIASGYKKVAMYVAGKKIRQFVHRLVAEAFVENPSGEKCVDHIDGNKVNNTAENLEWVSYSVNMKRAFGLGLCERSREASKRNITKWNETRRRMKIERTQVAV